MVGRCAASQQLDAQLGGHGGLGLADRCVKVTTCMGQLMAIDAAVNAYLGNCAHSGFVESLQAALC